MVEKARRPKRAAFAATALILAAPLLGGCSNVYLDPDKWSATVNDYNSQVDHKALVLDLDEYTSFRVWERDTPEEAQNDAMANCQEQGSNCQLVAVDGQLLYDVSEHFDSGGPTALDWATAVVGAAAAFANGYAGAAGAAGAGSGATSAPSYSPSYNSVPVIPLPTGTAGGTVSIGGSGASCGRRFVGFMPQSECRSAGYYPDSSITSDEVPDPVAGCYTPPC